jgi:hypothetical protein
MKNSVIYKKLILIKDDRLLKRYIYNFLEEAGYIRNIWKWLNMNYKITGKGSGFLDDFKDLPLWENWFREHLFLWTILAWVIWWTITSIILYLIDLI